MALFTRSMRLYVEAESKEDADQAANDIFEVIDNALGGDDVTSVSVESYLVEMDASDQQAELLAAIVALAEETLRSGDHESDAYKQAKAVIAKFAGGNVGMVCEACGKPVVLDAGTEMWQHIEGADSDACGPDEQRDAIGREGIYPVKPKET